MWLVERRARGLQPASEAVLLQKLAEGGDNITESDKLIWDFVVYYMK